LISGSDVLLDLHGGDIFESLTPFALFDESQVESDSRRLAEACDLPLIIRHRPGTTPLSGTAAVAASQNGIPSVTIEAGGGGVIDGTAVELHLRAVLGVLHSLGAIELPRRDPTPQRVLTHFEWVHATQAGWWESDVALGSPTSRGERIGQIDDLWLQVEPHDITAPIEGLVICITTSPAVEYGDQLVAIADGP
jgi:predicted deacylase